MNANSKNSDRVKPFFQKGSEQAQLAFKRYFYIDIERATTITLLALLGLMLWAMIG
jgi:hypothetical protein